MSTTVLRLKRKACSEPAEGLVVALKKSKSDETLNTSEVVFKFAATLDTKAKSMKDHIQAALLKDNVSNFMQWRNPKDVLLKTKNIQSIREKLKKNNKDCSEKKKLDLLNNRRLIFAETLPIDEEEGEIPEVRKLFHLYDIIEENEEVKKMVANGAGSSPVVLCNGEVMIREKSDQYVYDFYVADAEIAQFIDNAVGIRPCAITDEDIYSENSDESEEVFEDEDDSNDENNWRNDYPEEEDSGSAKGSDDPDSEDFDAYSPEGCAMRKLHIGDNDEEFGSDDSFSN